MLRIALRPRWLALLALVVVVVGAFGWLGSWQLGVARDRGTEQALREAQARPAVPIDEVLAPQRGFTATADSRRVLAHGAYDPPGTVLVVERVQPAAQAGAVPPDIRRVRDGVVGWWVVTPLRTDTGAWLPVVRGWVASPDDPAAGPSAVPTGPVTVHGVLQPDEASDPGRSMPDGQLAGLDAADLVNRWGTPIYNGFVVMTAEQTEPSGGPTVAGPRPVPAPQPHPGGIAWRNAAYAVQWWVFAGFAVVMWWKMVQQAARDETGQVNYRQDGSPSATTQPHDAPGSTSVAEVAAPSVGRERST